MTFKRPYRFLTFFPLGSLLLGFVCWMIGNPHFKHASAFRDWFDRVGLLLILLADIGLMALIALFSRGLAPAARFGTFVVVAVLFSFLCFVIMYLEYGVFHFGDSDLPPYQPDTPFERVLWSGVIFYAVVLLSKFFKRRVT